MKKSKPKPKPRPKGGKKYRIATMLGVMLSVFALSSCLATRGMVEDIAFQVRQEGGEENEALADKLDEFGRSIGEQEAKARQIAAEVAAIGGSAATGNYTGAIAGLIALVGGIGAAGQAKRTAKKEINYERNMARVARGEKVDPPG